MSQLSDNKIKEILLEQTYISAEDVSKAEEYFKTHKKISLLQYFLNEGIISKDLLGQAIAEYYNVHYLDLSQEKIDEKVFSLIPELVAKNKQVVALSRTEQGVKVGMANPDDLETRHFVEKRVGDKIIVYYITKRDLQDVLVMYKAGLQDSFVNILERLKTKKLSREERDKTVVEIVDMLLQYGYQNKASDIHIEPYEKKVMVRFRIDGIMHDVLEIPNELANLILTRIKILSKMRTDEHQAAQDGKLRYKFDDETIDVRVSVVPVTQGENVVMRLLSSRNRQFSLTDLGMSSEDLIKIKQAIKHPHGMILVTGPTGSGKTTTLYAMLKILNKREVNIATIEDPVEYDIESVSQIQVNTKTNLTFAKGLRALVRQDPDIIMVGEIRDEETAGIAINSALTGHLVLSTLHTNDAATTLPRLLDMNIEPFLVTSTINVVIAQRLVRKICHKCRISYQLDKTAKKMVAKEKELAQIFKAKGYKNLSKIRLYKGSGCKICGYTGYAGRIGVFEILQVSETIKDLILKQASSDEITEVAKKEGMVTMFEDGVEKVISGITTLEEVFRISWE